MVHLALAGDNGTFGTWDIDLSYSALLQGSCRPRVPARVGTLLHLHRDEDKHEAPHRPPPPPLVPTHASRGIGWDTWDNGTLGTMGHLGQWDTWDKSFLMRVVVNVTFVTGLL